MFIKTILLPFTFCLLTFSMSAQLRKDRHPALYDQKPLVIVDSFITDFDHLVIQPDDIISINVLKDSSAVSTYGEKAKNGVIIIKTKKNTEVIRVNDLITIYNIPQADRQLRVCMDHVLIKDPEKFIASKDDIFTVEVITDICWLSPREAGPEERYINIATKKGKKPF